MAKENKRKGQGIEVTLKMITESYDTLFDHAPVMMHSINPEGYLVKVNQRWLRTLGYENDEVIGQKSVDFLTDESRWVAVQDALPLFWRAGSSRSIGFWMVRSDGRVLNILLDAEAVPGAEGDLSTLATLRVRDSRTQWQQASTTLRNLRHVTRIQRKLEDLLAGNGPEFRNSDTGALDPLKHGGRLERATGTLPELVEVPPVVLESVRTMSGLQDGLTGEALNILVEASRDVAANLRALVGVHEDWREAILEQNIDLLLVIKNIDKTLARLADSVAVRD